MPQATASRNTRRAVTYGRQSRERTDKSAASPEAQRQAALGHVAAQGWEHVAHFEDLGRSGWDPDAKRPGLDAALQFIEEGRADVLVVYKLDRLSRAGVVEAVALVRRIQRAGGALVSIREPFLNLTDQMGLAIFGIFAALAQQESENISTRTRAAKAVLRDAGSHMSGRPPYGHRAKKTLRGGLTVRDLVADPDEAAVVREVVARALAGESVVSLAADLNARGVTTRSGAAWTTSRLGRLLRSPTIAGYMPAHREGRNASPPRDSRGRVMIATDAEGALMQPWEPIVDPADFHRLQSILDARPVVRGRTREASLLGGGALLRCGECGGTKVAAAVDGDALMRCGECEGPMVADRRPGGSLLRCAECGGPMAADRRPGGGAYRCTWHRTGKTRNTCPGVSVSMSHVEDFIVRAVFARVAAADLDDPDDVALLTTAAERFNASRGESEHAAERVTLEGVIESATAALQRLDDDRAAGLFEGTTGSDRYARQVRALSARIEQARADLAALPSDRLDLTTWLDTVAADAPGPAGSGSGWDSWELAERREFLSLFVDRVEVAKGAHSGGNAPFKGAERLRIIWAHVAE